MSRSALSLEAFDPDVLDAARDVARRAGVPLETWIESVVSAPDKVEAPRRKRPAPAEAEAAPPRPAPARAKAAAQPRTSTADRPDPFLSSVEAMMRRLDALDRSLAEERRSADESTSRAIEAFERKLASVLPAGDKPGGEMIERLSDIERRMGELQTHLAKPRPVGRRGRPLVEEMRDTIEEVRQRQQELEAGGDQGGSGERVRVSAPSPVITELQVETSRLRESLGSLATGRDVGALEQALRDLASDVHRVREPADLDAIATPMERMRAQVERLADEVADNVHARISSQVERLAGKVDGALRTTTPNLADRDALDHVFRELDDIRRMVASLAGPERIQSLAQGLQAISGQISQLHGGRGPDMEELKPLLEEIRRGLGTPDASKAILGRIDALADKMDRVSANPVGDLIGRLEDLGETLRRPSGQETEFAAIQKMLRGLAEKVDHVRTGDNGENLDALEKQVVAIARRLDARGADPAIAGLERMMGELLMQVSALRDEGSVEAAVERATRRAVEQAMTANPGMPGTGGVDLLRTDLAELCERQAAADVRMQSTMDTLNRTLERIVVHLDEAPESERPQLSRRRNETDSEAGPVPAMSAETPLAIRRPEARPAGTPPARDELLEPGTRRPSQVRAEPGRPASAPTGDIKANFIAAARRAAQAAQADIDGPAARAERSRSRKPPTLEKTQRSAGLIASLRGAIEKRRRPLLLGLAAIVLVIGAYQAFDFGDAPEMPPQAEAKVPAMPTPKRADAPPADTAAPTAKIESMAKSEPKPTETAKIAPADPQTTQSVASAPAPATRPAASSAIPKVASMESLKADLAGVPVALATLKQAALEGEGAAIFELATRESDGRGMPRDLALAAKLYEKLAGAGYAPAQFKIGSFYEKGSGVIRDLTQAKRWYEKAADQGNIRSMHNLAVIHAENPDANGKPDFATAASWFRRAAEYGVRDSQYNLAVLYARGLGVGQDLVQSYGWFAAAAAQGDEEAGKKRDDVAAKLDPKTLAAAKSVASAYKPRVAEAAANEIPAPKAVGPAPMSLLGAPPPGAPSSTFVPPISKSQSRPAPMGV